MARGTMDKPCAQRKWDREEVVLLVVEYFRVKNLAKEDVEDTIKRISNILRKREKVLTGKEISDTFRDYSGIYMQYGRIKCIDPETGYSGMKGTKLQKQVFSEYLQDNDKLIKEAEEIIENYS